MIMIMIMILKATTVKFGMRVWTLSRAKFGKNRLTRYTLLGEICTKITNSGDFGGFKPTFLRVTTVKFGVRVRTWDTLPHA